MTHVHIVCEGLTEIIFVREVLQGQLPGLVLIPFLPGKVFGRARGGDIRYDRVKPDILRALKHDARCFCTTFFDYYGSRNFPSAPCAPTAGPHERAAAIENAVADDIAGELGSRFDRRRFRPYFSMHEFEGLLFSDPMRLAEGLYRPALEPKLAAIRSGFPTPEHIDNSPTTHPSRRLSDLGIGYDKTTTGNLAAIAVGIDAMKRECPHFRSWLDWLQGISKISS